MTETKLLKVFLNYSSSDRPVVRDLYNRLTAEGWMDVWLDQEKLYPGQDWNFEIEKAVEEADVILVCVTNNSATKEGYVQRELRMVLDFADYKPEGMLFVIPVRLEECDLPRRLRKWQYADYFPENDRDHAFQRLLVSLKMRAQKLGISTANPAEEAKRHEEGERARLAKEKQEQELAEPSRLDKEREEQELAKQSRLAKEREEQEKRKVAKKVQVSLALPAEDKPKKPRDRKTPEQKPEPVSSPIPPVVIEVKQTPAEDKPKSFWLTLPGILTAIATLITAVAGLITAINSLQGVSPILTPTLPAPIVLTSTPASAVLAATAELGIGSVMISPIDGMTLVYVPAGEFVMGTEDAGDDEKPVHTVYVDAYWIDQTEVTNAMYAKCVRDGSCNEPSDLTYYNESGYTDDPVIYVSWNDAVKYCTWAGRELPTEAQWEKAASWDEEKQEKYTYPWGNEFVGSNLNFCDRSCSNNWADQTWDDGYSMTAPVGSYARGISPYSVFDMAGNVWEWVSDWYSNSYYSDSPSSNPSGPPTGTYRVLRGGSWDYTGNDARSALRNYLNPADTNYYVVGFRCSSSP